MSRRASIVSADTAVEWQRMRDRGDSLHMIAHAYHVGETTVSMYTAPPLNAVERRNETIRSEYLDGMTPEDIARRHEIHVAFVRRILGLNAPPKKYVPVSPKPKVIDAPELIPLDVFLFGRVTRGLEADEIMRLRLIESENLRAEREHREPDYTRLDDWMEELDE